MIAVSHLTKYYADHLAVDDLSFEIGEGHVYGFLGPNGAGKSTTMNIIAGCLSATEGSVLVAGHDVFEEPEAAKKCIGYLPEQPPLYMNETPEEYLAFVAEAKGLRGKERREQIESVMEKTGIARVRNRRISTLSKGYRQRVGIAQALLGNPGVIILDEPTVGLDPLQIIEIRQLIRSLGEDHTVIFSSHILSEVQTMCDRILMIAGGRLVAYDEPANLERRLLSSGEITVTTDAPLPEAQKLLGELGDIEIVSHTQPDKALLRLSLRAGSEDANTALRKVFTAFARSQYVLYEMNLKKADLEDVFIELTEAADTAAETADEEELQA